MMGCHSPPSHFRWLKGHETARRLGKRARGRAIVWFGVDTTGYQLGLLSLGIHSTSLGHLLIYNLEVEVKLGATGVRGLTALTLVAEPAGSCYHFGVSTQSWKGVNPFAFGRHVRRLTWGFSWRREVYGLMGPIALFRPEHRRFQRVFSEGTIPPWSFSCKGQRESGRTIGHAMQGHSLESGADVGSHQTDGCGDRCGLPARRAVELGRNFRDENLQTL